MFTLSRHPDHCAGHSLVADRMASKPTLCELVTSILACDYLSSADLAAIANACDAEESRRVRHARDTAAAWATLTPEQQMRVGEVFLKTGAAAATTLRAYIEAVNQVIIQMAHATPAADDAAEPIVVAAE